MIDKKLLAKNSFSGLFQKIIIAVITFLAIPVFIRTKGAQVYGIFAAISVLGELGRLTELGFNKTLVKFLSNQGRTKESSQDIVVATIVVLSILIPFTILLLLADNFVLLNILKIPKESIYQSRQLYNYAVVSNAMLLLGSLYSSVIESQRFIYKINMLQLVYSLLYWGLIIIVLLLGFDLKEIGLVIFISALIWLIAIISMMRFIWGKFELNGLRYYFIKSFKKLTNYSFKVYLSGLLAFFEEPLIKILVSNFFGVTYVGYLDIGLRIKSQINRLLQTLIYPFFQLFSEIQDKDKLRAIIKDVEEKLFLLITPLSIIIITVSGSFIHLWLGPGNGIIILSTVIITVGALLFQFTIMPTIYYLTIYHPTILIVTQIAILLINVLILYIGHSLIGYYSVYICFIAFYIVQALLRLHYQKKYLNCSLFTNRKYLKNFIIGMSMLLLVGIFSNFLFGQYDVLNLIISPIILVVATLLIFKFSALINEEDLRKYLSNYQHNKIVRLILVPKPASENKKPSY